MKEIQELIKRVEAEISKTPTGELRNLLCDANIVLQQQALNIAAVSVPLPVIIQVLKYCEDNQIYDKLGTYQDFYYKLNQIRRELEESNAR